MTQLVIAHRCVLKKKSVVVFVLKLYFLHHLYGCASTCTCTCVCLRFEELLFIPCPEMSKKWCGKSIYVHLSKDRVPTWVLSVGWSATNRISAAPGFYELQIAPAALFSLWLRKNGSFFVMFSKLKQYFGKFRYLRKLRDLCLCGPIHTTCVNM